MVRCMMMKGPSEITELGRKSGSREDCYDWSIEQTDRTLLAFIHLHQPGRDRLWTIFCGADDMSADQTCRSVVINVAMPELEAALRRIPNSPVISTDRSHQPSRVVSSRYEAISIIVRWLTEI